MTASIQAVPGCRREFGGQPVGARPDHLATVDGHHVVAMRFDHAEARTHDYKRHGTTTLFAALEVATGRITADACYPRHRSGEFLAFLKQVAKAGPDRTGRTRWTMRWKPALNAFAITFGDRCPAAETY